MICVAPLRVTTSRTPPASLYVVRRVTAMGFCDPFPNSVGTFPSTGNNKLDWLLFKPSEWTVLSKNVQTPAPTARFVVDTGSDHCWITLTLALSKGRAARPKVGSFP